LWFIRKLLMMVVVIVFSSQRLPNDFAVESHRELLLGTPAWLLTRVCVRERGLAVVASALAAGCRVAAQSRRSVAEIAGALLAHGGTARLAVLHARAATARRPLALQQQQQQRN
jgi:thiol:disulfide interchange protein